MKTGTLVALSYLSILAACGGGGSDSAVAAAAPQACAIEITGDSTAAAATPTFLLRAAFPRATVVSTALSGSTSSDRILGTVILGQGTRFQPFPGGVVGNVHLVNWGINDALYGVPLATYRANLETIASVPGTLLVTPLPSVGRDNAPYAQVMREVAAAKGVPLVDVFAYVSGLPNWGVLLVDGTHPGDALYRMVYANVVVPAVARLGC